jgi:hypothetical protein
VREYNALESRLKKIRVVKQLVENIVEDVGVLYKASEAVRITLNQASSELTIEADCDHGYVMCIRAHLYQLVECSDC